MWHKHAVWCQCALVMPALMAVASAMSIQPMSWGHDIYWSLFLCVRTVVQFISAEHAALVVDAHVWQRIAVKQTFVVVACINLWHLTQWPIRWHLTSLLFGSLLAAVVPVRPWLNVQTLLPLTAWQVLFVRPATPLIPLVLARYLEERAFVKTVGTSTADNALREAYAAKSAGIVFESVCLWSIRCAHRFPYTMRWTPVFVSVAGVLQACVWCYYCVRDTHCSTNAIIRRRGHDPAASLTAAQACPVCSTCLSALDMESSCPDTGNRQSRRHVVAGGVDGLNVGRGVSRRPCMQATRPERPLVGHAV